MADTEKNRGGGGQVSLSSAILLTLNVLGKVEEKPNSAKTPTVLYFKAEADPLTPPPLPLNSPLLRGSTMIVGNHFNV